jgi:hypothetical protein
MREKTSHAHREPIDRGEEILRDGSRQGLAILPILGIQRRLNRQFDLSVVHQRFAE